MLTEKINEKTVNIDTASTLELVTLINNEDKIVATAVRKELISISHAIDIIVPALKIGGRLIYCGAGTSGRLGVLDASECPPTFGVDKDVVQAIIAGGTKALYTAIEGVEDDEEQSIAELEKIRFNKHDVLVGIAASGTTPFVLSALKYAKNIGAKTIGISCNKIAKISNFSDVPILVEVGAEVIAGSTRMKAGTAQKMVLNMISTGVMIKLGKVYGNLM
ncbi:MAG: N-acetylmuramic acid 6-phosphate etherase, partial [Oscillospiraceae bacterium]